jgi:alcohol dehydrogenase class IV
MQFEFATATRIVFGEGSLKSVPEQAAAMGTRVLLVTGKNGERAAKLARELDEAGVTVIRFTVPGEPDTEMVSAAVGAARQAACDLVIGMGGGSVVDAGKAVAALLTNPGELMRYLEVIGEGRPTEKPSAPYIAIPTTAGTGAEVTRNAVIQSVEHRVKVSMRSPLMLPTLAVVDPDLTLSMPPSVTASTGLDALTQLLEAYVSRRANPLTDGLCREGLQRAAAGLAAAFRDGSDRAARRDMAIASLFGGLALANAGLGAVHGFAGPMGAMFNIPHGILCGRLLPFVTAANVRAITQREPDSPLLQRFAEAAVLLTGQPNATAAEGVEWIEALCRELSVAPLKDFGMNKEDIPRSMEKARVASSMKGNPIELTDKELAGILELAR